MTGRHEIRASLYRMLESRPQVESGNHVSPVMFDLACACKIGRTKLTNNISAVSTTKNASNISHNENCSSSSTNNITGILNNRTNEVISTLKVPNKLMQANDANVIGQILRNDFSPHKQAIKSLAGEMNTSLNKNVIGNSGGKSGKMAKVDVATVGMVTIPTTAEGDLVSDVKGSTSSSVDIGEVNISVNGVDSFPGRMKEPTTIEKQGK